MRITGLDIDCGIGVDEEAADALVKLDRYLCELKEMQIRDGLHVFGSSPEGAQSAICCWRSRGRRVARASAMRH